MAQAFKRISVAAARALWDKKGEDITLLNVSRTSPLADFFLIATALSHTHLQSLEEEVGKAAKEFHLHALHRAKPKSDQWRVIDYGGLIVHLMTSEARDFYALEKLHDQAPRVAWKPNEDGAGKASRKKVRTKK